MKISLFSDYALRTMMFAAIKGDSFQLDEVATAYQISRHHLAKIVNYLSKNGYLETTRGKGGGITLSLHPKDIRIGSFVKETESQSYILECFDVKNNTCPINGSCKLKGIVAEALEAFFTSLDKYTLHDIVTGPNRTRMVRILLDERVTQ